MGLTRCYKTEGFFTFILQFLYIFHANSIRYPRWRRRKSICIPTKFRWDTSIHGWDKTTSGFGWWMSVILEFYFQFPFWFTVYVWLSGCQSCCTRLRNFVVIGETSQTSVVISIF